LPAVADGGVASPTTCFRDNVIRTILFYAGFLLIIILFSEEFARALKWLRVCVRRYPQYRLILYPLLLVLIVAAGIIIATSLIEFSSAITFSYD
jgi:hypothetical protein